MVYASRLGIAAGVVLTVGLGLRRGFRFSLTLTLSRREKELLARKC